VRKTIGGAGMQNKRGDGVNKNSAQMRKLNNWASSPKGQQEISDAIRGARNTTATLEKERIVDPQVFRMPLSVF